MSVTSVSDMSRLNPVVPRKRREYTTPGPGSYEVPVKEMRSKFKNPPTVGMARHGLKLDGGGRGPATNIGAGMEGAPGPGDYNVELGTLSHSATVASLKKQASFGKSLRVNTKIYVPTISERDAPLWTPGPGAYEAVKATPKKGITDATLSKTRSSPAVPFSKVDRDKAGVMASTLRKAYIPAPGAYDRPSTVGGSSADSTKKRAPAAHIPKATRFGQPAQVRINTPAFKYNIPASFDFKPRKVGGMKRTPSFRIGGRGPPVETEANGTQTIRPSTAPVVPGPGSYNISVKKSTTSGKMSKATPSSVLVRNPHVPGPGRYPARSSFKKGAQRFGKADRRQTYHAPDGPPPEPKLKTPGPGEYESSSSVRQQSGPGRFSKTTREDRDKLFHSFASGKGDLNAGKIKSGPGPGQYNLEKMADTRGKQKKAPAFSMPKTKRSTVLQRTASGTLGPGEYQLGGGTGNKEVVSRKKNQPRVHFGTVSRTKAGRVAQPDGPVTADLETAKKRPGPGSYEIRSTIGVKNTSVKASGGGKFSTAPRSNLGKVMAPGAPPPESKIKTPAPGAYANTGASLGRQLSSKKISSPGFKFGTSSRSILGANVG